jgi:hypothetical protein
MALVLRWAHLWALALARRSQDLRVRRVLSWALVLLGLLAMAGVGVWSGRRAVLAWAGGLLVAEDPVAQVDLLVISGANPLGAAVEAVRLYRERVSPRPRVSTACWS